VKDASSIADPADGPAPGLLARPRHAVSTALPQLSSTPALGVDVFAYIEESNRAPSPEQVFDLFRRAVGSFGYDKVAFAAVTPAAQTAVRSLLPRPALVASCPQEWIDRYQACRYHEVDPCLLQAPMRLGPYTWADTAAAARLSARQRTLFREARDIGLCDGVCLPVHGPAGESYVVSLSGAARLADTTRHLGTLQILATQLQLAYTALARNGTAQPPVQLSDRERECLTWTARGKSAWSIGHILSLSEHTVQFHLKAAIRKVGAGNRVQAVVAAIRLGLIAP
jgi:DNA-binding CsgD family transcriptional regulator